MKSLKSFLFKNNEDSYGHQFKDNAPILKTMANYNARNQLIFRGSKNTIIFFEISREYLIGFASYAFQGQMKILYQRKVDEQIAFLNKSNQFIMLNQTEQILVWEIHHNQSWRLQQSLSFGTIQKDNLKSKHIEVSKNDQLILISNGSRLHFLIKDADNKWICQQTIKFPNIEFLDLQLNEKSNKLICQTYDYSYEVSRLRIISQNADGLWALEQNAINQQVSFYFLDNETIAIFFQIQNLISIYDTNFIKLQQLNFQFPLKIWSSCIQIVFQRSKQFLILVSNISICIMKQEQGSFQVKQVVGMSVKNFKFINVLDESGLIISGGRSIQFNRIYEN